MLKRQERIEQSLDEATDAITTFFLGNSSLIETFIAVCKNMISLDNEICICRVGDIIGASKAREYFRFYVCNNNGEYTIKYKDRQEKELFSPDSLSQYFSYNISCHNFFIENKETVTTRRRTFTYRIQETATEKQRQHTPKKKKKSVADGIKKVVTMAEWTPIQEKYFKAAELFNSPTIDVPFAKSVYSDIINLLLTAGDNTKMIDKRNYEIFQRRILNIAPMTLEQLGEMYSISRERVRQCAQKSWRTVSCGMRYYTREQWVEYREQLKRILLAIPDEKFVSTILYIYKQNKAVGIFLLTIVTNGVIDKAVAIECSDAIKDNLDSIMADTPPELMRDAATYYHRQLRNNPKAKPAIDILHSWGIYGNTVVRLGIGFHDNSCTTFIRHMADEKGYSLSQLESAKLIAKSSTGTYCDAMRNSIIVPTIDENSRVICFDYYIIDKKQWCTYPNSLSFQRFDRLYSYNLAVQTGKKSVLVVSDYNIYYKLAGKGICNLVATYLPMITEPQLSLLKQKFKVIMILSSHNFNRAFCEKYCRDNDLLCDALELGDCDTVEEFIDRHEQDIVAKIDMYEHIDS